LLLSPRYIHCINVDPPSPLDKCYKSYIVNVGVTKKGRNRAVLGITRPDPALDGDEESIQNRQEFQMGGRIYLQWNICCVVYIHKSYKVNYF